MSSLQFQLAVVLFRWDGALSNENPYKLLTAFRRRCAAWDESPVRRCSELHRDFLDWSWR